MSFISYAQNYEDVILYRVFKDIENGTYIDVGAYDPEVDSVTKLFYDQGWRGINIEPVASGFERLCEQRPGDVNLQVAVGDREGEVDFYEVVGTGLSTTDKSIAERHVRDRGYEVKPCKMPITRLSTLLEKQSFPDIHFLKVDVEGSEDQVLRGLDLHKHRPWVCIVESTRPNLREESFQSWEPILLAADYEFGYFDGLNRWYVARERRELIEVLATPPNVFDDFNLSGTGNSPLHYQLAAMLSSRAGAVEQKAAPQTMRNESEAQQNVLQVQLERALDNAIKQDELLREKDRILKQTTSQLDKSRNLLLNAERELEHASAALLDNKRRFRDQGNELQSVRESLHLEQELRAKRETELLSVHRALTHTDLELRQKMEALAELQNSLNAASLEARQYRAQLLSIHASRSWRITLPLRKAQDAVKWLVSWPARAFRNREMAGPANVQPEAEAFIVISDGFSNADDTRPITSEDGIEQTAASDSAIDVFTARIFDELDRPGTRPEASESERQG